MRAQACQRAEQAEEFGSDLGTSDVRKVAQNFAALGEREGLGNAWRRFGGASGAGQEIDDGDLEKCGSGEQVGSADAVARVLVLLDLLEGEAEGLAELRLRVAALQAALSEALADLDVDGIWWRHAKFPFEQNCVNAKAHKRKCVPCQENLDPRGGRRARRENEQGLRFPGFFFFLFSSKEQSSGCKARFKKFSVF